MERNSLIPHPDGGNVYHLSRLDLIERKNHALPIPSREGQKNKRRAARSIQIFCLRPLGARSAPPMSTSAASCWIHPKQSLALAPTPNCARFLGINKLHE